MILRQRNVCIIYYCLYVFNFFLAIQIAESKIDELKKTASEHEAKEETSNRMLEMQAKVRVT